MDGLNELNKYQKSLIQFSSTYFSFRASDKMRFPKFQNYEIQFSSQINYFTGGKQFLVYSIYFHFHLFKY